MADLLKVGRSTLYPALNGWQLILGWTFNVVDDEDFHGTLSRFKFQTKLLL